MTDRDRIAEPSACGVDAAPYVLGALEPGEASAFARHLERCGGCRDEVAALGPALEALPAAAPAYPVPRALRRRVMRAVRDESKAGPRRARVVRWLAISAAAAAAAVVLLGGGHPHTRVIRASVGQAELRITNGHGQLVVEHLAALPADRSYEMWLQSGNRAPVPSTLFAVSTDGQADLGVPGDLHGITRVLVTAEPRDGSLIPTTRAVIQVPLSYVRRS